MAMNSTFSVLAQTTIMLIVWACSTGCTSKGRPHSTNDVASSNMQSSTPGVVAKVASQVKTLPPIRKRAPEDVQTTTNASALTTKAAVVQPSSPDGNRAFVSGVPSSTNRPSPLWRLPAVIPAVIPAVLPAPNAQPDRVAAPVVRSVPQLPYGGTPVRSAIAPLDDSAHLRPGLVVNVSVLVGGKTEIEAAGKRITDNGTIAMPLLGTVDVHDQSLDEVSAKLTISYKDYFVNPQVIVEFVRDDNKEGLSPWGCVTVLGRVKKPGKISIPATRDLTLSAAIQQAGGFDTSAKQSAIRITRRLPSGKLKSREVNFRSVGSEGQVDDDIRIEPDDVIFVPEQVF